MNNPNNRRMIVIAIVAVAVLFGVFSLATISSYNQGMIDGMSRGTQIVVPSGGVHPAPQAPNVVQQPYYGRPPGGFSLLSICFNVLMFLAIGFVITRILCAVSRRHKGGPWSRGNGDWRDWRNVPFNNGSHHAPNDFRNSPNKQDEQVI